MGRVEDGQPVDDLGVVHRERPGRGSAPVVADHERGLGAALLDETADVGGQLAGAVGGDAVRFGGQVVSPQVGRDDAEARCRERRDLQPPAVPELREAVQQNDQRPVAGFDVMQPHFPDVGVALPKFGPAFHISLVNASIVRGTALLHQIGEGYGPWAGEVTHRTNGVLVSDRTGTSNAYGLFNLQERSELFIGSGVDVYEGMIVGENARSGDMDVNPCKEKKLTNIRTHSHDEALRLTPPRPLTLESAIEFIGSDELVEVTPTAIRLRKRLLVKHERERERGRAYDLARQG